MQASRIPSVCGAVCLHVCAAHRAQRTAAAGGGTGEHPPSRRPAPRRWAAGPAAWRTTPRSTALHSGPSTTASTAAARRWCWRARAAARCSAGTTPRAGYRSARTAPAMGRSCLFGRMVMSPSRLLSCPRCGCSVGLLRADVCLGEGQAVCLAAAGKKQHPLRRPRSRPQPAVALHSA